MASPTPPPPPPKPTSRTNTPSKTDELDPLPLSEPFVPRILLNKSRDDLQYLAHSPVLLSSLFTATHPVSASTAAALTSSLTHNITLAQNLSGLEESLVQQREATQQKLVETKALERRWREKENEMYQVLQPFSSVAQIGRLQAAVGEAERLSEEMAEDFLGGVDGSEVETWIRGYRELREVATLRKERAGRLAEGRVGNWR